MTDPVTISTPLPSLPVTKALLTLLADVTAKPWGGGSIPTKPGSEPKVSFDPPFGILYFLYRVYNGTAPFGSREGDVTFVYQATYTAKRADAADWGADKINEAIFGRGADSKYAHDLAIAGMYVMDREDREESGPGPGPDVPTELFTRDVLFGIRATPSKEN